MFSLRFPFAMRCNSFVNLLRFAIDICVTEALLIQQGCRIRRGQLGGREMHFCKFPQVHHKQRHYGRSCQGFCCPCTSCGNHRMILDVFVLTSNSNRRFRSQTDYISLDFSHPGCISEGRLASTISLHWERAHEILFFLLAGAIARKFQARVNRGWTEGEQRLNRGWTVKVCPAEEFWEEARRRMRRKKENKMKERRQTKASFTCNPFPLQNSW